MQKPHKFDIGEGYGIWEADGETHRSFPDVFYRAKPGDSAGKYRIGDDVVLRQPSSKMRFGCSREHLSKVLHGKRKANERIARGLRRMGVEVEVA